MANWVEIGVLNDIPRLGARVVRTAGGDIAVFRNSSDEVFALQDRCPHKQGPLSQGIVAGRTVTCPLHNYRICLESGQAMGSDEGCTDVYPVKLDGDKIFLGL
jgi:nitrite reductase (NADH) small subunit